MVIYTYIVPYSGIQIYTERKGATVDTRKIVKQRKSELICEYVKSNKSARVGSVFAKICIFLIFVPRALITLFQTVFFSIVYPGIHLWIPFTIIPLLLVIRIIDDGHKALAYLPLSSSVIFMIIHFSLVYHSIDSSMLKEIYTVSFFITFMIQFFASLIIIFDQRCDAFFTAKQKINIKAQGEIFLKQREEMKASRK